VQPFTDLRDYRRSPQFPNHWIVAVSGFKFFRETSFARSPQAGLNKSLHLDSGLEIKHDPCRRVVAHVFLSTRPSVYTAVQEPVRQLRRK
jgi:hypothetical protein